MPTWWVAAATGRGRPDALGVLPHLVSRRVDGVEVTPNFSNPFWQVYCFLVVAFAATHGFNGLRVILEDYIRHPLLMAWLKALLVGFWLFSCWPRSS